MLKGTLFMLCSFNSLLHHSRHRKTLLAESDNEGLDLARKESSIGRVLNQPSLTSFQVRSAAVVTKLIARSDCSCMPSQLSIEACLKLETADTAGTQVFGHASAIAASAVPRCDWFSRRLHPGAPRQAHGSQRRFLYPHERNRREASLDESLFKCSQHPAPLHQYASGDCTRELTSQSEPACYGRCGAGQVVTGP